MKIVCLVENTSVKYRTPSEHGLSLYIDTGDKKILFDMGQTDLFEKNAKVLGIPLEEIDIAVLSHGHYDHTGGFKRFTEINKKAPVYISCHAFGQYYNKTQKYIGVSPELKDHPRLILTDGITEIAPGITLYPASSVKDTFTQVDCGLLKKNEAGEFIPDDFRHEQYMLIETDGKRTLFSGCSHKGILNIADSFRPHNLIGGFHFSHIAPGELLRDYALLLRSYSTQYYTCHCTGKEQFELMRTELPCLYYLSTGEAAEI